MNVNQPGSVPLARTSDLLSDEHFSVDGTLIEAWASQKSFQRKDQDNTPPPPEDPGNPTVDFHGEERRNDTMCKCPKWVVSKLFSRFWQSLIWPNGRSGPSEESVSTFASRSVSPASSVI